MQSQAMRLIRESVQSTPITEMQIMTVPIYSKTETYPNAVQKIEETAK